MIDVLPIADKELFLKYAIPCGRVLVERGTLDSKVLERLHRNVTYERDIRERVEECFPVASKMTSIIARRMGKDSVDAEVIRKYFLLEHKKAVDWRARLFPDIRKEECIVYPARVLEAGNKIVVNTPVGERAVRDDFVKGLKRNDWVTVHYDFVGEMIDRKTAERMLRGIRE